MAGAFLVPESKDPKATPLDPLGAVLSIAGLVALVYAIIEAPRGLDRSGGGWRLHRGRCRVIGLPLVGGAHRASDAAAELFRQPEVQRGQHRHNAGVLRHVRNGFLNTQYLQFVLGYTPLEAGLRVMPVATMIVAAPLSARLTERFGTKVVVASGLTIVAVALSILATITIDTGYGRVVGARHPRRGHGHCDGSGDGFDHGVTAIGQGGRWLGHERHDQANRRRPGVAILGSILASSYGAAMDPVATGFQACSRRRIRLDRRRRSPQIGEAGALIPPPRPSSTDELPRVGGVALLSDRDLGLPAGTTGGDGPIGPRTGRAPLDPAKVEEAS